jgi:prevent-host-death family protein
MAETVPLATAKDKLSEYVEDVERTRNRVTITRYGRPVAVLVSPADLDGLLETIDLYETPGAVDEIEESEAEIARGEYYTSEQVQADLSARIAREKRSA